MCSTAVLCMMHWHWRALHYSPCIYVVMHLGNGWMGVCVADKGKIGTCSAVMTCGFCCPDTHDHQVWATQQLISAMLPLSWAAFVADLSAVTIAVIV